MSDSEQKYSGDNFRGADHASPYPVSRLGAPVSLVDMARVIESASAKVALRTNAQLEVIVEQMKALQERAREIIEQASRDVDLIHAECRFHRVPGRVYHLFERADGHRFFSMLGPDEYGGAGPSGFVASYRYEHDESWTRLDEIRRAAIAAAPRFRGLSRTACSAHPTPIDRSPQPVVRLTRLYSVKRPDDEHHTQAESISPLARTVSFRDRLCGSGTSASVRSGVEVAQ